MTDPTVNPQGTLSQIDNPLAAAAIGAAPMNGVAQQPQQQPAQNPSPAMSPVSGGASLGQIIAAKGQPVPSFTSPHATAIGDNVDQALKAAPQVAAQPGGIMRTIVGAGLQALSSVQTGLGDIGNIGAVPAGGGALYGVGKTLQARNQRVAAQKMQESEIDKNRAIMADSRAAFDSSDG
jgi:hypothetical protein